MTTDSDMVPRARPGSILLIDDDPEVHRLIAAQSVLIGLDIECAADGQAGIARALSGDHRLYIVDVNMPHLDGFEVCRKLRQERPQVPILMLTSRDAELDRVLGLELGADDYVTKPFSVRELVARIKALLRRGERQGGQADRGPGDVGAFRIVCGRLTIDRLKRRVFLGKAVVELTAREYQLLEILALNPGRAFTRVELLELAWDYLTPGYEGTVTAHLCRLRAKLEANPDEPVFIKTVYGIGYRFFDPEQDTLPPE